MMSKLPKREKINMTGSTMDLLVQMSEGNPGGATVLGQILTNTEGSKGLLKVLSLDDMNIRGSQIWVGYKDHCKEDIDVFMKCIDDRDPAMIKTINDQMEDYYGVTAVQHNGASGYE
jgi:hypothetical protein